MKVDPFSGSHIPTRDILLLEHVFLCKMASGSQVRAFALLGDSNINRHINKTSIRAHPSLKTAQVLPCGHLAIFSGTLEKVKKDVTVCVVACLTNFISSSDGPTAIAHRIDPVLQEVRGILLDFCSNFPAMQILISPPMYRTSPTWYGEGLPEVLTLFSQVMSPERPGNLHILPSFATPEFDSGGVHLTPYSGLEYILHLFDSSHDLLAMIEAPASEVATRSTESTRVLEDRVMALEQDHRRLNRVVEHKTAVDAELDDFHKNERFEDSFLIEGLPRIPNEFVGKAWQDRAVRDVKAVLTTLMGRDFKVVFVQNATSRVPNAEVKYNVQMAEISDSK